MADPLTVGAVIVGLVTAAPDGDTIHVGTTRVRLWGIAAPPLTRGKRDAFDAAQHVRTRFLSKSVTCVVMATPDGRITIEGGRRPLYLAHCALENVDLAADLVAAGLARDCPAISGGYYATLEAEAARRFALPEHCRLPEFKSLDDGGE